MDAHSKTAVYNLLASAFGLALAAGLGFLGAQEALSSFVKALFGILA